MRKRQDFLHYPLVAEDYLLPGLFEKLLTGKGGFDSKCRSLPGLSIKLVETEPGHIL